MKEVNTLDTATFSPYGAAGVYSPLVSRARSYLRSKQSKPNPYQSRYEEQIAGLYDQIMNRPAFSYSAENDPLYQQYRSQYIREGQRAMQDTVGATAALTGGYGSSWANTAGYQAYGQYLQALNDRIPELEKRARENYEAEGDALRNRLDMTMDLDDREYGWYRDAMSDWQYDEQLALERRKFNFQVQKYLAAMADSSNTAAILPSSFYSSAAGQENGESQASRRVNQKASGKTALAKHRTGR